MCHVTYREKDFFNSALLGKCVFPPFGLNTIPELCKSLNTFGESVRNRFNISPKVSALDLRSLLRMSLKTVHGLEVDGAVPEDRMVENCRKLKFDQSLQQWNLN